MLTRSRWGRDDHSSGGLQEYIEAISFLHFLEHDGGLISLDEVQARLTDSAGQPVRLSPPCSFLLFPVLLVPPYFSLLLCMRRDSA